RSSPTSTGSTPPVVSVTTSLAQDQSRIGSVPPAHRGLVADGLDAALAGADPHRLGHGEDEQQAVARLARVGRRDYRLDHPVGDLRRDDALDLQLGQQADVGPRAAVVLRVALLAAAALHLGDVEAADADLIESVLDRLEALVADDRLHLVHR